MEMEAAARSPRLSSPKEMTKPNPNSTSQSRKKERCSTKLGETTRLGQGQLLKQGFHAAGENCKASTFTWYYILFPNCSPVVISSGDIWKCPGPAWFVLRSESTDGKPDVEDFAMCPGRAKGSLN